MRMLIVLGVCCYASLASAQEVDIDARRGTVHANFNQLNQQPGKAAVPTPSSTKPDVPTVITPPAQSHVSSGDTDADTPIADNAATDGGSTPEAVKQSPVQKVAAPPMSKLKMRLEEITPPPDTSEEDDDQVSDDCE